MTYISKVNLHLKVTTVNCIWNDAKRHIIAENATKLFLVSLSIVFISSFIGKSTLQIPMNPIKMWVLFVASPLYFHILFRTWTDENMGMQCRICGKVFTRNQTLPFHRHLATHDSEPERVRKYHDHTYLDVIN